MSRVVIKLNKWFGINKLVSLVDRHESNGVEPTNKSILRHLRALIFDYRLSNNWSDPTIIALIEHFLNSAIHIETNLSPCTRMAYLVPHSHYWYDTLTIGTSVMPYLRVHVTTPDSMSTRVTLHASSIHLATPRRSYLASTVA